MAKQSICFVVIFVTLLASFAVIGTIADDSLDNDLLESAFANDIEKVKAILAHENANINVRQQGSGQTPLMGSVLRGNTEMVQLLLQQGADTTIAEKDGYTPPHGAGFQGRADVMKLLHESGVDVTEAHSRDGYAPFHRACWGREDRHTATVEYLLKEGLAHVNLTGLKDDRTCMDMTRNPGTMRVLKEYEAKKVEGEL